VPTAEEIRAIDPELALRVAREPDLAADHLRAYRRADRDKQLDKNNNDISIKTEAAADSLMAAGLAGRVPALAESAARRRPGRSRDPADPERGEPLPDVNRNSGLEPVAPPRDWPAEAARLPIPDRWRLADTLGLLNPRWYDPYNPNVLKGDRPVRDGNQFVVLALILDSVLEPARLPTPVGPQSTTSSGAVDIFGAPERFIASQNLIVSVSYLKGDTTFRPPDYEFRITPVFNINYARAGEARLLRIDPREGRSRTDGHVGLQELFGDYHLRNVSDRYDFDSIRLGIQPFSSDFRGFLFQDNPIAARLFGTRANNRYQYNLAWLRRLEKDTNSGLNAVDRKPRNDDIFVANLYAQDLPTLGFTTQAIVAHNINREDDGAFYDENGFIQRPASIGLEKPRRYRVTYLGLNGDGHFGRLNLTASGYWALGRESRGLFRDAPRGIRASFVAAEASYDVDWTRLRLSLLHASGDDDPFDDEANGFDAIFENPVFAGADTNFWTRQAVPLVGGGGVALTLRNGMLNSLRTSREHGQSNFDNPGSMLVGMGADMDLTSPVRLSININHLWFEDSAVLQVARNQGSVDRRIGWDLSAALIWRPYFTQNIVLRLSAATLLPGRGFRDLFPDQDAYSVLGNFIFTY
jgi:hypothetical protein